MQQLLSQNLLRNTAVRRAHGIRYYQLGQRIPRILIDKIARRVRHDSFELLLQVTEQAAIPIVIEIYPSIEDQKVANTSAYLGILQNGLEIYPNKPELMAVIARVSVTSWVVTYSSSSREDYAFELFDQAERCLLRMATDANNAVCWRELLDALPLMEDAKR